jgi:hypothetical protein
MAHFAEIDNNNKVIRVLVACNQDIANNGGEQSEQAATAFQNIARFSENGVKWVQTSYNNNFRKQFASVNCYYDQSKDKFILNQPFPSWSLDSNDDWQPPVERPSILTIDGTTEEVIRPLEWNEDKLTWSSFKDSIKYYWNNTSNTWKTA